MAQPTQDTDISSSFISTDFLQNNNSTRDLFSKEMTVNSNDNMNLTEIYERCASERESYKNQEFDRSSETESTIPWLVKFNKLVRSSIGTRSYQLLQRLLSIYRQNILRSTDVYCLKLSEIIKLKNHLSSTLTFFHFYWHDIKEHINDHSLYLNEMSLLLGKYIDMELKTSKQSKDANKVTTKVLTMLWIYLSNSEEYIFRVLFRVKLITKKYMNICDPILMKSFTNLRRNGRSITDMEYVRCLLILKLWKRIKESPTEKKKINKLATMVLGSRMPKMSDDLLKIIPKPPIERKDETIWLLQPNVFDLKQVRDDFMALEETIYTTVEFKDIQLTKDLNNCQQSQIVPACDNKYFHEDSRNHVRGEDHIIVSEKDRALEKAINNNKRTNNIRSMKRNGAVKKLRSMKKLKPGEVVFIDLTEEDESARVHGDKKRKNKNRRSLEWLKLMTKKYKVQKQSNRVKCNNQVEIADAHSTESSENSVDQVLLEYLPISDNKVSESTERCALLERELLQNQCHSANVRNTQGCNKRSKECTLQQKQCDICSLSLKHDETQHNRVLCLLKLLNVVGYDIKDPKAVLNIIRESKGQNAISSQTTFLHRNTPNTCTAINTQSKEESFPQQGDSIETMLLSKECQNNTIKSQSIKQELPTSTDYNITIQTDRCPNELVYSQNVNCHSLNARPINDHNSQTSDAIKQKLTADVNECPSCCKRIETNSFSYNTGNVNPVKMEDVAQNITVDNVTDKKSICDKNIICMLSDLDKCVDVLNRIGEHIMSVHAETQRTECLDKTDVCAVSTTVSSDQLRESSLGCSTQNINALTNAEKLNKLLGLCVKKEFLNTCTFKDFCTSSNLENGNTLVQQEYGLENCKQQTTVSTSGPEKLYLYENVINQEPLLQNKLSQSYIHNHIKTEVDDSIDDQDPIDNTEHKNGITETQIHSIKASDVKDNHEISKQDVTNKPPLQIHSDIDKFENTKPNSMDDFENIDILDSILNGDMTVEDEREILEDSQSTMMSPICYDNSTNVLNCITEFFGQSEHAYASKKEEKSYASPDLEISSTPLPEGSLGTTGILNSLLDFELTGMDSPPNDFMYSHVQTVNPRLIKKNLRKDVLPNSIFDSTSEASTREETQFLEMNSLEDAYNNQNDSIDSSVDVVGFGLNVKKQQSLEFSSMVRNSPTFPNQSSVLINSTVVFPEITKSSPKYASCKASKHDTNYVYQKEGAIKRVQSFTDLLSHTSTESCASKSVSTNLSRNYSSNPTENSPLSHSKVFVSPSRLRMNTLTTKHSLDSCNSMSSENLRTSKMLAASECKIVDCENSQKRMPSESLVQQKLREDTQHNYREKQNRTVRHKLEANAQTRASKRKLRYERKNKEENEDQELPVDVRTNSDKLGLRYSQLSFNPSTQQDASCSSELPLSSLRVSCQPKSFHTFDSKDAHKQLKCIDIQDLRNMSRQEGQILLDLHGKSTENVTLENNSKSENNRQLVKSTSVENSHNICASTRKSNTVHSRNRTGYRFPRRNVKVDTGIVETNFSKGKRVLEEPNDDIKSDTELLVQNVDAQSSKLIKKQVLSSDSILNTEETPLKRRKIASKFLSVIETDTVVCTMNEQESQEKRFVAIKTDFVCTNRRRNAVV